MRHVPTRFWLGLVAIASALVTAMISHPVDEVSTLLSAFMLTVGSILVMYAVLVDWPMRRKDRKIYERLLVSYIVADRMLRENTGWEIDYEREDFNHSYDGWVHMRRELLRANAAGPRQAAIVKKEK